MGVLLLISNSIVNTENVEYFEFSKYSSVLDFCWNTKIFFNIFLLNFMFWHEYWNEYTNSFLCVCTFMHSKNHHSGRKRSWRFSQFSCVLPRLGNWDIRDIVFNLFLKRIFSKLIFDYVKIKLNVWENCRLTIIVLREDKTSCKWSFRRFTYGNLVTTSPSSKQRDLLSFSQWQATEILRFHLFIQSVGATGGVYKGQGLIQRKVMTCAYKEFLVQNK